MMTQLAVLFLFYAQFMLDYVVMMWEKTMAQKALCHWYTQRCEVSCLWCKQVSEKSTEAGTEHNKSKRHRNPTAAQARITSVAQRRESSVLGGNTH